MRVKFKDNDLALVETNQAHRLKLPVEVIVSARKKLQVIRQAEDERDLYALKSLHYEKLQGEECRSIRLNVAWRMILELNKETEPIEVIIVEINNHYS